MPAVAGRPFGIGWRLNIVLLGPGETILRAEAAALPPALFGGATTARMVLTWERLSGLVGNGRGRNRQPQAGHQIGKQRHPGTKPVPHAAPAVGASSHGCQSKAARENHSPFYMGKSICRASPLFVLADQFG